MERQTMPFVALALLFTSGATVANPNCLIVRDPTSAQDVRIEAHGANAVRVRAVTSGGKFRDDPDVVSALTPLPTRGTGNALGAAATARECTTVDLETAGASVSNGNLKAAVGSDGRLVFTRVSDSKVLLTEKIVRTLTPTETVPPVPGFFSLELSFEAVEGERIYGLGQHAAFSWDPNFPVQLDQKGLPAMLLEPHDGDITIPVAHSSLGYAFLSNLPSTGSVEYNSTGSFWRHDAVLQVDMWVATTSDSPPHAVSPWGQLQRAYADATGHAPVYPHWASGFWQCKLRYANQSQVLDVVKGYIDRDIPISLIIVECVAPAVTQFVLARCPRLRVPVPWSALQVQF
jgi:alpha-D-xyloside xylohydrolase